MNPHPDVVVVGSGLAGACAAFFLSRSRDVLLVEQRATGAGASRAAAGLVNPLTGRRARPVWRMQEALSAFHEALRESDAEELYLGQGILRPAMDEEQAERFRRTTDEWPEMTNWLDASAVAERFPRIHADLGGLFVRSGGAIDIPRFCGMLIAAAVRRGASARAGTRLTGWRESTDGVHCELAAPGGTETIETHRLLIAPGAGYRFLPALAGLNLHPIKGQTVRVVAEGDAALSPDHPHVAGHGYVVNTPDGLVLGSTFEHQFSDECPTRAATLEIVGKAEQVLPGISSARVEEELAGVRVTVPGVRLPMVGPLPDSARVWIIGGLGSKGSMMAPLIGRNLDGWLADPGRIPAELRPSLRRS